MSLKNKERQVNKALRQADEPSCHGTVNSKSTAKDINLQFEQARKNKRISNSMDV